MRLVITFVLFLLSAPVAAVETFSASTSIYLVSDYVFRGVTQTDKKPPQHSSEWMRFTGTG